MEFLLPCALPTSVMAGIFAFIFLFYVVWMMSKTGHRNKAVAPEAGGAWPLIGHMHLLGGPQRQITLGRMADKYGPIFTIRLGVHRALVVSSWEMAKECFSSTNDRVFCNRPKAMAVELMGYNYAMFGLGPYGQYWREMRKIVRLELLSNHRLSMLNHVRESEVKASIKELYEVWVRRTSASSNDDRVMVEMKKWFGDITLNLILRIVVGKQCRRQTNDGCHKTIREFFDLIGAFTVSDALPFLRCLDLGGYEAAMKKTGKELDGLLQGWLEEHKQRKMKVSGTEQEYYFIDVMLSILDGHAIHDADTITKATCLTLLLGASDTTGATLTWALSLLLNNRHALKKAQDELDTHVGRIRHSCWPKTAL
uniref:Uncharacterized protein n=2 Tax=Davidia involucrata TaxID=16924 RepID=A0A5B7A0Q0_DAVIN